MSLDLHFAPFLSQLAIFVNQECAAFDAHELSSVQVLFPDDVEFAAQFFVGIADELERELVLRLELFMGRKAVSGNTEYHRVLTAEFRVQVAKVLAFRVQPGVESFG